MPDLGLIVFAGSTFDKGFLLSLKPKAIILELTQPTDMRHLVNLANGFPIPIYPYFRLYQSPGILGNMITQAIDVLGPVPVYLSMEMNTPALQNLGELPNYLVEKKVRVPWFYLCSVAHYFIGYDSLGEKAVSLFRQGKFDAAPCIVVSNAEEQQHIWRSENFLRFLHQYPNAQFHVASILKRDDYDYNTILEWERPTFFRSPEALEKAGKQWKGRVKKATGYLAEAKTNRDRVTAFSDVDLRTPVRKLSNLETVYIVEFLSGKSGKVVKTTEGDYIAASYLTVDDE